MDRGVRQVAVHRVTEVSDTTEHRVTASDLPLSPYSLGGRWGILLAPMVFKSVSVRGYGHCCSAANLCLILLQPDGL